MDLPAGPAVVLTRKPEDNLWLRERLEALGIGVVEIPCAATRFVDPGPIDTDVDAVVFTSRNGAEGFLRLPLAAEVAGRREGVLVCAVGKATAAVLAERWVAPAVVAETPCGEALAAVLKKRLKRGSGVLMVRGNLRASGIDAILEGAGHRIIPCIVYENYDPIVPVVGPFPVSSVFVGSPSAGERLLKANPWMRDAVFVAIGKTTKSALEAMGVGKVLIAGAGRESWLEAITGVYKGTAG